MRNLPLTTLMIVLLPFFSLAQAKPQRVMLCADEKARIQTRRHRP